MATRAASAFKTDRIRPACNVAVILMGASDAIHAASAPYDVGAPAVSRNCQNLVKGMPGHSTTRKLPFLQFSDIFVT